MAYLNAVVLEGARNHRAIAHARGLILAAAVGLLVISLLAVALGHEDWPRSMDEAVHLFSDTMSVGLLLWLWILLAGLAAVAGLLRRSRLGADAGFARGHGERWLAAGFIAFAALMLLGGSLQVKGLQRSSQADLADQQAGIARLKADQVDAWADERAMALQRLALSLQALPLVQVAVRPEFGQLADLALRHFLAGDPERIAAGVFQSDGTPMLTAGDLKPTDLSALAVEVRAAAEARKPMAGALRTTGVRPAGLSLAFLLPVRLSADRHDRLVFVSVVDPSVTLLRRFGEWPTYSATGEVELVTQQGQQVVHIVPGKRVGNAPPLAPVGHSGSSGLLAAAPGAFDMLDHRGNRVLAATVPVRQLPWVVIARTDHSEAEARIAGHVRSIWTMTLAIVLFGGVITLALDALLAVAGFVSRPPGGGALARR